MIDDIDLTDLDRFAAGVPHEWTDRLRAEARDGRRNPKTRPGSHS